MPLVAGRWLTAGDTDAIVMSRGRGNAVGQRVSLSLDGHLSSWTVVGLVDPLPLGSAFVRDVALAQATHTEGRARLFRVGFAAGTDAAAATSALGQSLARAGASVALVEPFSLLHGALDDHVLVLTRAAVVLAGIIALIGLFGLAAAMGISILERTRELGVMKAIGASGGRIARLVIGEAVTIGAASWLLAAALTVPATWSLDRFLSAQGFISAMFVISPLAIAGWLAVVVIGSAVASFLPARRAARLTVRESLAET